MKNSNRLLTIGMPAIALLVFSVIPSNGYCQGKSKEETLALFPQPVSGVFGNSCVGCHNDQSQGKAKEFLNFSSWDKLTAKEQKKTSKEIGKMVRKNMMPPAGFLEKFPQAALTPDRTKTIQNWASAVKKGK